MRLKWGETRPPAEKMYCWIFTLLLNIWWFLLRGNGAFSRHSNYNLKEFIQNLPRRSRGWNWYRIVGITIFFQVFKQHCLEESVKLGWRIGSVSGQSRFSSTFQGFSSSRWNEKVSQEDGRRMEFFFVVYSDSRPFQTYLSLTFSGVSKNVVSWAIARVWFIIQ